MIKKFFLGFCFVVFPLYAQTGRTSAGLTDVQQLGIMAGVAQACGAGEKLRTYELIANRIIANPTPTKEMEKKELRAYAVAKLTAYQEQQKTPVLSCREIQERFNKLPIFQAVVYKDGTVKMPDGRIIKPTRPLGKKNPNSKK